MPNMSIRLSDGEYSYIQKQAAISGKPLSTYCKCIILGYEVKDTFPRKEIGRVMCVYHNKIDDAKTIPEARTTIHEMEKTLWQLIK